MYNVAIIGAGPAGIFSALEIVKLRPEWKVVLIEKGQKIAQLVLNKIGTVNWIPVESILDVEGNRGGGFGSTGLK